MTQLQKYTVFVLCIIFISTVMCVQYGTVHAATLESNGCDTIHSVQATPSGYASPVNVFNKTSLLMQATCFTNGSVIGYVGDGSPTQYIYKYGYQRIDGDWERLTYQGSQMKGPWIIGSASTRLDSDFEDTSGKFIAYICQKRDTGWKCGCSDTDCKTPKWQVQKYKTEESESSVTENSSCNDGSGRLECELGDFEKTLTQVDTFDVYYPSKYIVSANEEVTFSGSGFEKGADIEVLWNDEVQENSISSDAGIVTVTAPALPPGKYEVRLRKNGELTEHSTIMWISTTLRREPKIYNISPETVQQGETITITGTNFSTENNDVLTSLKEYNNVISEDGKTITLEFEPYDEEWVIYNEDGEPASHTEEVSVTVVNTGGISNNKTFTLQYD